MTWIPLHDVIIQNDSINMELKTAMSRVLDSGMLIKGKEVNQFENDFANYLGIPHCIGVGNATDGFEIAFRGLGLPKNAEVIIPANAHVSPALAALKNGLTPVFADVHADRMLITADTVEAQITERTKAVVAVHLYGRVCPMDELTALCQKHNLILIEDFSQAQGAHFQGKKVGSFGTINVCSFYPTKPLGALGDGGAITTSNKELAEKCRTLANYGWAVRDNVSQLGQNSRLDELQAAVLNVKLKYLDKWNAERLVRSKDLRQELKKVSGISADEFQPGDICHLFVIRTKTREKLLQEFQEKRVAAQIHYPIPIHQQTLFENGQHLPISERLCCEVLSVPLNQGVIALLLKT